LPAECQDQKTRTSSNTNQADDFLAVYAGETKKEASTFLKKVKATGRFKGANLRSMQVVVDTTH